MLPRTTHKGTRSDLSVLTRTLRKTWNRLIPNGMTDNLSLPDGTEDRSAASCTVSLSGFKCSRITLQTTLKRCRNAPFFSKRVQR